MAYLRIVPIVAALGAFGCSGSGTDLFEPTTVGADGYSHDTSAEEVQGLDAKTLDTSDKDGQISDAAQQDASAVDVQTPEAAKQDTSVVDAQTVDSAKQDAGLQTPLTVVTWNVHDLYDDVPGNCPNPCPYEPVPAPTTSDYQQKVSSTAGILAQLQGDVVMLQEIENLGVLDKLAAAPALSSLQYQYRTLLPGNDPRGINIGFMSRYPISDALSHKDDEFTQESAPAKIYKYTRDALEVHLYQSGKHLVFIGVHFKAKASPDDPEKRLAEAQHTRKIAELVLQGDPSAYVWVLGDFNDTPGSMPVLAVQDGKVGPKFDDAANYVAASNRYTYTYGSQRQLIDHLFASPAPAQRIDTSRATIVHDGSESDHAPIGATYNVH